MHLTLRIAFVVAIITSALVLATQAFQWVIADRYTVFGIAALEWAMDYVFLASILVSVFALVRRMRLDKWRAAVPLLVNLLTLLLATGVPWTSLYLDYLWWHNERGYSEVVRLVQAERLKPAKGSDGVKLPAQYSGLSTDGAIGVEGSGASATVFFTTFEGILGHFSGYIYVPRNVKPPVAGHGDWDQVILKKPHWYFVAST
jgi:hypothetical protein